MTAFANEFLYIPANEIVMYQPTREERNYAFMAYTCAFDSKISKGRHCAVLLNTEGVIVDTFVNRYATRNEYRSVHAEQGVIAQTMAKPDIQNLNGYTLIVVRSTFNSGNATNSRPCKNCYNNCKASGIKRVIYSKPNNEYGCIYF